MRVNNNNKQSQKGLFLSGLIIIFGVAVTLASILLIFDNNLRATLGHFPGWFSTYVALLLLGRLISLSAIWNEKRWGVYALFLFECVEVGVGNIFFTGVLSITLRLIIGIPALIVVFAVWYLALRRKWYLFT